MWQIFLSSEINKKFRPYGTYSGLRDEVEIKYWTHGGFVSFSVNFWMKQYGQKCIFSEMTGIYIPDAGHETIQYFSGPARFCIWYFFANKNDKCKPLAPYISLIVHCCTYMYSWMLIACVNVFVKYGMNDSTSFRNNYVSFPLLIKIEFSVVNFT